MPWAGIVPLVFAGHCLSPSTCVHTSDNHASNCLLKSTTSLHEVGAAAVAQPVHAKAPSTMASQAASQATRSFLFCLNVLSYLGNSASSTRYVRHCVTHHAFLPCLPTPSYLGSSIHRCVTLRSFLVCQPDLSYLGNFEASHRFT